MSGPLDGVRIVEMAGLGPVPFAAMLLADMGADIVRVDRVGDPSVAGVEPAFARRGRRSIRIDLKSDRGRAIVLDLVEGADALVEGFRPGVMERLGLSPDVCLERNPDLVFGRMTGWGQEGPWAGMAGHDIDYIALSGMLGAIGPAEQPIPPLNLLGDYGGGAMFLVSGVLAGVIGARAGQGGTVVDAAMVDGSAYLGSVQYALMAEGWWRPERESNLLDGGAPYYRTYATADGEFVAVGALEPQFYAELLVGLGLDGEDLPHQHSIGDWPEMRRRFAEIFARRTRTEWMEVFEGTDACVAPVLSMAEAPYHPHNVARAAFVEVEGAPYPAAVPRFSRSDAPPVTIPPAGGHDTDGILAELGRDADEITRLRDAGVVA